ncbi:hypothetical protein C0081_11275 [Cohaesibacter celericrescens]|uniref:Uncharacterized protein n=1 Tax=Cohaesibacter celericrescens TaxID=2067669 RepID=A0A2N5XRI2_9HYPH|nr:hypothetical protein C0081_11275 [Cohaesibacter celericrescens]
MKSFIEGKPAAAPFITMKKADKVARLHALFNNEVDRNGLSAEVKERIAAWVPDCLTTRYNAPQTETSQEGKEDKLAA